MTNRAIGGFWGFERIWGFWDFNKRSDFNGFNVLNDVMVAVVWVMVIGSRALIDFVVMMNGVYI